MESPPDKRQGVKAIQINRARIKERIQEKHRQQNQQVRQGRLSALREADGSAVLSSDHLQDQRYTSAHGESSSAGTVLTLDSVSGALCFNVDGTLVMPVVRDWSDIGHEFGVNIHDTDVMECLLALEDEIRQEQLFQFYDQTNGNEWDEYYHSLISP
ncbi:hypothetical protein ABL78_0154 [Leptomonas seymouri]|uniref:Uncharacterized protein n=1 Tax=Leptomonas seymouri TaxID=5684 RepID=A0A0N1I444_LEPSE|nr:hypothetical protein ABL78_0154 [Leptomonas seymouri]|eukprot:KPI90718.1 hypothetical protein ABL78_0154 [Leptomonas seymouri]